MVPSVPAAFRGPSPHPTYEAEMEAMNRRRIERFRELRAEGLPPNDALRTVNAESIFGSFRPCPACLGARAAARAGDSGWCVACDASWHVPAEPIQLELRDAIGGAP